MTVAVTIAITGTVLWAFIIGTIVPVATDLVTKSTAPAWLKTVVNLLLAAIAGALSGALNAGTLDVAHWQQIAIGVIAAWVASVASFYGVWKPSGASGAVSRATPHFGLG